MVSPINSKSNNQLNNNSKSFNRSSLSIERESISNSNLKNFNNDNSIEDSIKLELKNRMLISGEWLKLSKLLRDRLKGSKWEEDLRCQAESYKWLSGNYACHHVLDRALEADHPSLHTLMDYLRPIAQAFTYRHSTIFRNNSYGA
ncbi:hypothetical protein BY996DRAFT_6416990 [Phakopsora pachyrhizi]|nr:hypothetical protein BY996DRAFT_6416990 [Phakopsora pachyrhizi]